MDWAKMLQEIQRAGMSQTEIGERINRSQAWISAAASGKYQDVKWADGEALRKLHAEVVGDQEKLESKEAA